MVVAAGLLIAVLCTAFALLLVAGALEDRR